MTFNGSSFVFMNNNKVFALLHVIPSPENDLLTAAVASGAQGMNISNYPNAQPGDIWNGTDFIKMSPEVEPEMGERIGLLVGNELVYTLDLDPAYPYYQIWKDGFAKEHIVFNATGHDNIYSGATWDGKSFTRPEVPAY
jgi:hypothetical protein